MTRTSATIYYAQPKDGSDGFYFRSRAKTVNALCMSLAKHIEKTDDDNNFSRDFYYYPYANLGYEYFIRQHITTNFYIYHVTTTGRKNSVAWNDMVDMTEYEVY